MTSLSFSRGQMVREATLTEADLAEVDKCRRDHNRPAFAYQIGFGANYQITPYLVASADFRYLMTTNFAIPGQTSGDSDSSRKLVGAYREPSLFVGLNYKFGGGES